MRKVILFGILLIVSLTLVATAFATQTIPVGHMADLSGPTSGVGTPYAAGITDTISYINKNGGINGKQIEYKALDYSYNAPRAVATYKKWLTTLKPVAIQGWGTADTEALLKFIGQDKIAYFSASYSSHLTDPKGTSKYTRIPAPYNYFYGPSYSDACRGLVQYAADDWKAKGKPGQPKWIHMGSTHPAMIAPKPSCEAYAEELGFEVLPTIVYDHRPADFKAQCLSLKETGAEYSFLSNTMDSNISLLKSCNAVGVDTQYLTTVWGFDENAQKATGKISDGIAWVVGASNWDDNVPGSVTLKEISKMSDPSGKKSRVLHYQRGVCSTLFMKEAMLMADAKGEINGTSIKEAMDSMRDFVPAGMEGVCLPSTWTEEDHRGTTMVNVYTSKYNGGDFKFTKKATIEVPRRPEWLGW